MKREMFVLRMNLSLFSEDNQEPPKPQIDTTALLSEVAVALQGTPELYAKVIDWHNDTVSKAEQVQESVKEAYQILEHERKEKEQIQQQLQQVTTFNEFLRQRVPLKEFATPAPAAVNPMEGFLKGLDEAGLKKKW